MPKVQPKPGALKPRGQQKEARHDKVLMEPGEYEVTRNSTFTLKLHLKKNEDKWWVVVSEKEATTTEEVTFRMWTYDEMVELRKLATKYDQMRRVHMIDHDVLNRLKIQRYMLSWTFEKENQRFELHHVQGVLSDETWAKVKRLQTNLLRHIIEQMNERYEFGG
jgi:hypothetical protein